jgi:hypothetical protein
VLPNFVHIGAPKAASTWLWKVCGEHPDIYVPEAKPVNFFVAEYHKGIDWYESTHYGAWNGEKAVGDLSNGYMAYERALERCARHLGHAKILMTVRPPIERSFVHWGHFMWRRKFTPEQVMSMEQIFKRGGFLHFMLWLGPSLYAMQLKRVYRYFPKEQVKILWYEELEEDPDSFLTDFFEFLEVDPNFRPGILNRYVGFPSPDNPETELLKRGIDPEMKERLKPLVRDDVEEFQEMTGRDLSHWME